MWSTWDSCTVGWKIVLTLRVYHVVQQFHFEVYGQQKHIRVFTEGCGAELSTHSSVICRSPQVA